MEIPRHWRIRKQRYSMLGGSCPSCDAKMFPVRTVCPNCGYGSLVTTSLTVQSTLPVKAVVNAVSAAPIVR
jgi:uncharacterized OB-fold protein